jgi:hypothetical protein
LDGVLGRSQARARAQRETQFGNDLHRHVALEESLQAFEHGRATATRGPQSGTTAGLARLLIIFPPTHFLLDAASLNQFAKPADRLLNGLAVPDVQLNHTSSFRLTMLQTNGSSATKTCQESTLPGAPVSSHVMSFSTFTVLYAAPNGRRKSSPVNTRFKPAKA